MNGSPLFTGDAGSGESEIRRWILESDYLEALIQLPKDLFYNTGISTYVWVLSNNKPESRKGQVVLIDASEAWLLRQKSLGSKRRDIPDGIERAENYLPYIMQAFEDFKDQTITIPPEANASDDVKANPKLVRAKVFSTAAFGYRKVTIERPLRLNFEASLDRIERVKEARAFQNLATSRKKDPKQRQQEIELGEMTQKVILKELGNLPKERYTDRDAFVALVDSAIQKVKKGANVKITAPIRRAIIDALSERDPDSPACVDKAGVSESDSNLRDYESVPLDYLDDEGVPPQEKVQKFFEREVQPHVDDAWINESVRDQKDGEVGVVGYEINFNRYFYQYQPPRPLEAIEKDIKQVEEAVLKLLQEVAG